MRITRKSRRPGATIIEAAFSFWLFLTLAFGMLDLGIGVFRHNTISEAARQGTRQAIVHGSMAPPDWNGGPWGPSTIGPLAANTANVPILDAIRPFLIGSDLSQTQVLVEWIDSSNELEKRVRVTVSTPYRPMMTWIFGNPTITLSASSTMPIAH